MCTKGEVLCDRVRITTTSTWVLMRWAVSYKSIPILLRSISWQSLIVLRYAHHHNSYEMALMHMIMLLQVFLTY